MVAKSADVMLYMQLSAAKCAATSGQCTLSFLTVRADTHTQSLYPRKTGVGTEVGTGVGDSEGSGVGTGVGIRVGTSVGRGVGSCVGRGVGRMVGGLVGNGVGK